MSKAAIGSEKLVTCSKEEFMGYIHRRKRGEREGEREEGNSDI